MKWGGADAFAGSIESGIVLLNRIPNQQGFEWLEEVVRPFPEKQREDGAMHLTCDSMDGRNRRHGNHLLQKLWSKDLVGRGELSVLRNNRAA